MLIAITALAGENSVNERVAKAHGFSLHAGVSCEAPQRAALQVRRIGMYERLGRQDAGIDRRPPSGGQQRLTVNAQGKVVYLLGCPD